MTHNRIQQKWKEGFLPGYDGLFFGDGSAVIANHYRLIDEEDFVEYHWYPLCDTTIEGMEKYEGDLWTPCDIWHGAIQYQDQKFVFGDGAMGNEGYIASTTLEGELNWAFFFTFSNPICKAEIDEHYLIAHGDGGVEVRIDLDCLTSVKIKPGFFEKSKKQ